MIFVNKLVALPNLLMNKFSSVFLAASASPTFTDTDSFLTRIFGIFTQIFYFAAKWLMYLVDVMYFYVLQLVGVGSDTTIFDSSRTDPTFRLLIDNKEIVTTIIKNFIGIALVLIIVTAIVSLIRQQAQAMKEAKANKNQTNTVLKSMLKSVVLLIITPIVAILGIMASTTILQGLYRATNLSNAKSLSTRVFNASASVANKYKSYADSGVRIPIKYGFSGDKREDAIDYTVEMLGHKNFPNMDYFNENNNFAGEFYDPVLTDKKVEENSAYRNGVETWVNETYYKYFDSSDDYNPTAVDSKHKRMTTHKNEYYAMSDVVCFALDTMEPLYFVTIQELLESIANNLPTEKATQIIQGFVDNSYALRLLGSNEQVLFQTGNAFDYDDIVNAIKTGNGYSFIQYTSKYSDGDHTYVHVKDAVDEMEGAKFVMGYKTEDPGTEEAPSIYGDYAKIAPSEYLEVEKFYFRKDEKSRYQKVDLYYSYNADRGKFEKVKSYDQNRDYYYKLGEDYIYITNSLRDKFYYKLKDSGEYVQLDFNNNTFYNFKNPEYYMPLAKGVSINNSSSFSSEYIKSLCFITARGIFDDASYPTAIQRLENGNIMFYRDDLAEVVEGDISGVAGVQDEEVESEEEQDEEFFKKAFSSIKKFVSSIWNPKKLYPNLDFDESKVEIDYTNKQTTVAVIEHGKMHITYFFADDLTSKLLANQATMKLQHLFEPLKINYVVLLVGSVILFRVMMTSIFATINRAVSLFLMFLIYPLACSTLPLDEVAGTAKTGSYKKWADKFIKLVLSLFGLILSINFVFIIIPAIDKLEFFTPEDLQSNRALARIANVISGATALVNVVPNFSLICNVTNKILRLIFQIAAFSLITTGDGKNAPGKESFYTVIQNITKSGGEGVLEDSPMDNVGKLVKKVSKFALSMYAPTKTAMMVIDTIKKGKEMTTSSVKDAIPGSQIVLDQIDKDKRMRAEREQTKARKDLLEALQNKASKEEIDSKLKEFQKTHKSKK